MTKPKRYKRYSSEFKREAILRASEEGNTDKAVCEELGNLNWLFADPLAGQFHNIARMFMTQPYSEIDGGRCRQRH